MDQQIATDYRVTAKATPEIREAVAATVKELVAVLRLGSPVGFGPLGTISPIIGKTCLTVLDCKGAMPADAYVHPMGRGFLSPNFFLALCRLLPADDAHGLFRQWEFLLRQHLHARLPGVGSWTVTGNPSFPVAIRLDGELMRAVLAMTDSEFDSWRPSEE